MEQIWETSSRTRCPCSQYFRCPSRCFGPSKPASGDLCFSWRLRVSASTHSSFLCFTLPSRFVPFLLGPVCPPAPRTLPPLVFSRSFAYFPFVGPPAPF